MDNTNRRLVHAYICMHTTLLPYCWYGFYHVDSLNHRNPLRFLFQWKLTCGKMKVQGALSCKITTQAHVKAHRNRRMS